MSVLFFSRRMDRILDAIRVAREGDYNYKLEATEKDELGILAQEFNALTERIQTTETMRRQFVSDASHELKTPLAAITLMTDSVLQNEMDKGHTILEFVGDIGTEANRLSRMTEKLLQLSRLENVTETKAGGGRPCSHGGEGLPHPLAAGQRAGHQASQPHGVQLYRFGQGGRY